MIPRINKWGVTLKEKVTWLKLWKFI